MFSSTQLFELFIVLCTIHSFRYTVSRVRSAVANAQAKGGAVRPDTVPTGLRSTLFNALQFIIVSFIPMGYILTVMAHGLQQPPWMGALALPDVVFGVNLEGGFWKHLLRVLACAANLLVNRISDSAFEHLGDQYHPIGRRERPRVVQTGPYAWVRHPLYSLAMLQGVRQSLVFWSYVPLFALVAVVGLFAIKIIIEEELIQRDDVMKEEYRAYMRKVPARLVPYVW